MTEKGIRVKDALAGDVVATRDAYELDESGAPRTIQLVDLASRQCIFKPMRGVSGFVTLNDSDDLGLHNPELSENMIDAGDKKSLIVRVEHNTSNGSVDLTPIAITDMLQVSEFVVQNQDSDGWANPTTLNTTSGSLVVGSTGGVEGRAFFKFSFSGISQGTKIESAKLSVWSTQRPSAPCEFTVGYLKNQSVSINAGILFNDQYWEGFCEPVQSLLSSDSNQWWNFDLTEHIQNLINQPTYNPDYYVTLMMKTVTPLDVESRNLISAYGTLNPAKIELYRKNQKYSVLETKSSAAGNFNIGADYLSPLLTWNLNGARKIGLHVRGLSAGNGIKAYGDVI